MHSTYLNNSGLIITAPFLPMLFDKCDLLDGQDFKDVDSIQRAVLLLQYTATATLEADADDMALNKLLCGMELSEALVTGITISEAQMQLADDMLLAITQQWTALRNTTIDGLRDSFLKRAGKLEESPEIVYLNVKQKAYDMLLDQIPWNISAIKLSWMPKLLQVEWR